MSYIDYAIYTVHTVFWMSFGITRMVLSSRARKAGTPVVTAQEPPSESTAKYSKTLLAFHMVAFGVMYFGIGNSVLPNRVPHLFTGQAIVGTLVIVLGAALMSWALIYFQSWRFRAKLDTGHQLATGGPFRLLRHPIYMGLNMLAIGSAIWVPTATMWVAVVLMAIGSDLRGRAEEKLLTGMFGDAYTRYCEQTRRFIPGVY